MFSDHRETKRSYRYIAKDAGGRSVKGTAIAADREALYSALHAEGLYLQSAAERREGKRRMIKASALSEFCRQLSGLVAAGISIARALSILAKEEGVSEEMERICASMLERVRTGASLADAMEAETVFPELALGMIRAGESTGDLDKALKSLADHYEKQHQMEQSVRSAMVYPVVLCVMAVVVIAAIFAFVLPRFQELFTEMETLPLPTRMLLAISDFMSRWWYLLGALAAMLILALHFLEKLPNVRLGLDRMKLRLPFLGGVNRVVATARFARSLSSLYSGGAPIVQALDTAKSTVGNAYIEQQFERVLDQVRSGVSLSRALQSVDGFRQKLISAIAVGEESGQLDTMLQGIAETMEFDAQQSAKRMVTILEPLLIVVMALAVGLIMVGVMLPMVNSYGAMESYAGF